MMIPTVIVTMTMATVVPSRPLPLLLLLLLLLLSVMIALTEVHVYSVVPRSMIESLVAAVFWRWAAQPSLASAR